MTGRMYSLIAHLALFLACCAIFWRYTCDDSFITFRYAQNAASGLGLVFNPGERVEGYSNPLWLSLLVVAVRLGLDVVVAAKVLGLLAGLGALLFAYGLVRKLAPQSASRSAFALLPLIGAPLAYYSVSGLETSLYACLLTGLGYCLLVPGGQWAFALLALGTALTRPEGLLVMVAVLAVRLLAWRRWDNATWQSTLAALIAFGLFLLWRHSYFGLWLPNTYYAKPPGAFGGESLLWPLGYVRDFLLQTGAWLWLALGLIWARQRPLLTATVLLIAAVETALVVHARGDWMALHRFLLPVLPLLVALGYAALLRLTPSWRMVGAVVGLTVGLNGIELAEQLRDFRDGQYPQYVMAGKPQRETGEWLRQSLPEGTTLACKRLGGVAYYSGLRMVDVLGLTDRGIASIRHRSGARGEAEQSAMADEVFRRRPGVIMLCAMKRWHQLPLTEPPPDLGGNLRDVDNALYAGLERHGYRFVQRLPQGGSGEFVVYSLAGPAGHP